MRGVVRGRRTRSLPNQRGARRPQPQYVIGTEVPAPGGSEDSDPDEIITSPSDLEETISATKAAFERRGLHDAWNRVIAVVVEPGSGTWRSDSTGV
jgi:D-tagatose-1,6-bisphosphate aldolase subunit GatZ/KbaZ